MNENIARLKLSRPKLKKVKEVKGHNILAYTICYALSSSTKAP